MKSFKEYTGIETPPASLEESVKPDGVSVKMGSTQYNLEVADTPDKIIEGLSYRENIPQKTGMLFVMPKEQIHEFWMKDCLTDMDIIFLTTEGQIVNMENMIKERHKVSFETNESYQSRLKMYSSKYPAKYAIEIPPGDISRLGLEVGQYININNEIEEQATAPPLSREMNPSSSTRSRTYEPSGILDDIMQYIHTGHVTAKTRDYRRTQKELDAGLRPEFRSQSSSIEDKSKLAAEFGIVDNALGIKRTGPNIRQTVGLSRVRPTGSPVSAVPVAIGTIAGELLKTVTEPALDAVSDVVVQSKFDSDFEKRKEEPWYKDMVKAKKAKEAREKQIARDRAELIKSDLDSYRPQFP